MKQRFAQINAHRVYFHETPPSTALYTSPLRRFLRRTIPLAMAGVATGCALAGLSTRVLKHLIFGVSALDPLTCAGVALGLLAIAAVASFLPALRLATLNPADTLRDE